MFNEFHEAQEQITMVAINPWPYLRKWVKCVMRCHSTYVGLVIDAGWLVCDMQPTFEDQKLNYGREMLEALFAVWIRANSPQQAGPQTAPDAQQGPDTDTGYKLLFSFVTIMACTRYAYALVKCRGTQPLPPPSTPHYASPPPSHPSSHCNPPTRSCNHCIL